MTMTKTANYRVIAILTNDFGAYNHGHPSKVDETIKWSGTDLDELSRQYPPSNIFGADPLGHSEIEDGLIRYDYRFERQRGDGSWETIDDPRRRITPMTALDREIDAENRRLYPGDFITGDDCDCGSSRCPDCNPQDYDQYYCDNCRDAGCSQCDPSPDCSNCDDRGCEQCDPEAFPPKEPCSWCGRWFETKLLTKDGLCTECENDRLEELKPCCADCDSVTVDNAGDVCSFCQEWRDEEAKPRCIDCQQVHTDPKLSDGDICRECDDYWHNQYNSYYRWYKRLWRWVRHRQ